MKRNQNVANSTRFGKRASSAHSAFTLVELLVVIAIIGVLVALLLPAVQAARESARRTTCLNQMRQMMIAMHNHESARKFFPSGGIMPWPLIEDYQAGGKPFAAPKQGLSWAFQILPYLEQGAVHNLATTQQVSETPIALYFCPSRRPPTQNPNNNRWLMDYAALIGAPTPGQEDEYGWAFARVPVADYPQRMADGEMCFQEAMWGGTRHFLAPGDVFDPSRSGRLPLYPTQGVIRRSSYFVTPQTGLNGNPEVSNLGLPGPTKFRNITDGTSNTIVLAEKYVPAARHDSSGTDDDAGWSDGWDYDTLRLASCRPVHDSTIVTGVSPVLAGSSHPAVFIVGFADASMQAVNYDVDLLMLNRMANMSDGEVVDKGTL